MSEGLNKTDKQSPWIVPEDDEIRQMARKKYQREGEIEIDVGAKVSLSEDTSDGPQGAYVQAWVYVEFKENPDYDGPAR